MADHWNSLANLLGTPSLAPPKPKGDPPTPPSVDPVPPVVASEPPRREEIPSEEKPKTPEKSRLKSSWDAVAGFFGIASPETESTAVESNVSKAASQGSGAAKEEAATTRSDPSFKSEPPRRGKPSMWDDRGNEQPAAKASRPSPHRDVEASDESPVSSEGIASVERGGSKREPAQADRRSHRRPPRRAQASGEGVASTESEREQSPRPRRENPRSERAVNPRAPQSMQGPRSPEPRTPKKQPSFGEGIDGVAERELSRGRDRCEDKTPQSSEDDTIDYIDSDVRSEGSEPHESSSESRSQDSKEGRPRRRRRGGRGRNRDQSEGKGSERRPEIRSEQGIREDADSEEESAPSVRHSKIPTWCETISVLVEANMQNHQRSQGSHRGNSRGRPRR